MTIIHTSDWHLGRPFHSIRQDQHRHRLQRARLEAVARIGEVAREEGAACVLVAGDLFDSPSPSQQTVAAALGAIGALQVPVHVLPGNHDHGGPGGPWGTQHFRRERDRLAPNLVVHETGAPVEVEGVILLPARLVRRHEIVDPTRWVKEASLENFPPGLPRVLLAHGSTTSFSGTSDPDDALPGEPNLIDLQRLPMEAIDYVALGDWHGLRKVGEKAWYSGTPEPDRMPKGADYVTGKVLVVRPQRGKPPQVKEAHTGVTKWRDASLTVTTDGELDDLLHEVESLTRGRVGEDVLRITVTGSLGLSARTALEERLGDLEARLLQLDLILDGLHVQLTDQELMDLAERPDDPMLAVVATALLQKLDGEEAAEASLALQRLHAYVMEA